jgi:hypothetical protein
VYAQASSSYQPTNGPSGYQGLNGSSGYQGHNGHSGYQTPNGSSGYQTPMYTATANYGPNIASPQPHRQPHRLSNPAVPHPMHNSVHNNQGHYQQYGVAQSNGNMGGNWF